MSVIAVDVGGTKVSGAVFETNGRITGKMTRLLENRSGIQVGDLIIGIIDSLISGYTTGIHEIQAIGICVPGIANSKTGKVWAPNIRGWEDYPLQKEIEDHISHPFIRVKIASDRTCYILGEVWKGNACGCENAVFISVGTGIGVGILIDGQVLHGHNDIVGASGWLALQTPYLKEYEQYGCFESHASGNGMAMQAKKKLQSGNYADSFLNTVSLDMITAHDIFSAYAHRDRLAVELIDHAIQLWGMAAANLVSLLNPEKIIWGGGVFGPAVQHLDQIYEEACRWAQPISIRQAKFEKSALTGDAGLCGAGYLALLDKN